MHLKGAPLWEPTRSTWAGLQALD